MIRPNNWIKIFQNWIGSAYQTTHERPNKKTQRRMQKLEQINEPWMKSRNDKDYPIQLSPTP